MASKCDICGKRRKTLPIGNSLSACSVCKGILDAAEKKPPPLVERLIRPKVTSGKTPTAEQQEILDLAPTIKGALMIEAGAGTGKTTELRMLADVMPGNGQYTAFNTDLVKDNMHKFAETRVACNTTHSLAFRTIGKEYSHRLGGQRVKSEIIARLLCMPELEVPFGEGKKRLAAGFLASRVMDAIRRFCQSADREITTDHFRYVDGIDVPSEDGSRTYSNNERMREYLLPFARCAWADIMNKEGQLPFGHDHYVKIWQLSNPVISADYILLDEAQDTAPVFLDILKQQKCPVILVGDSAQQIYEWRGAVNAMQAFPGAPRKFLSQSFRFGEAIAQVANTILSQLSEPTGLVLKGLPSIQSSVGPVEKPRAILCRTNAVAVSTLLNGLALGDNPRLVGKIDDIISFVEASKRLQEGQAVSHPDLACFNNWYEVKEYVKEDEGEDLRLMVKLIDTFTADAILNALKNMPLEKDADYLVSTAHKSKGLEWDTVRLANDFPTADKCGDQEIKLVYVASTRARIRLDVSGCPFFNGEGSVNIDQLITESAPMSQEEPSIVPPAPSTPPAPQEFTWSRDKNGDGWLIRGPSGMSGEQVEVVRKDGSRCWKTLRTVVWSEGGVALYRYL